MIHILQIIINIILLLIISIIHLSIRKRNYYIFIQVNGKQSKKCILNNLPIRNQAIYFQYKNKPSEVYFVKNIVLHIENNSEIYYLSCIDISSSIINNLPDTHVNGDNTIAVASISPSTLYEQIPPIDSTKSILK